MNEPTARYQLKSRCFWAFALVCAGVGALVFQFWGNATRGYIDTRSLFYWWGVQWFDPAAEVQHGLLVLVVSAWLFWRNLRIQNIATTACAEGRGGAVECGPVVAMLAGLALHLGGYAVQQARVSIVALVVFAWGVLALAGGRRWARAAVFPLGFLLLAVPVNFLDTLGFHLRLAVSERSFGLAKWFGVELVRNGTQLVAADGRFQYDVAAACSGVRSLVALVALALLVGYLGFRSWWARVLLAVACLPCVLAGNVARVLFLVLVGGKVGDSACRPGGWLHEGSGLVVFAVVLGLLLAVAAALRRLGFAKAVADGSAMATAAETVAEKDKEGAVGLERVEVAAPARWRCWVPVAAVVVMAVVVAGAAAWLDRREHAALAGIRLAAEGTAPAELPVFIGTEWMGREVAVSEVERATLPADTGYSRKNYVSFANRAQQVFFSVVLSGRDRTSIHRPEICLVGQGWTVADRTRYVFRVGDDAVACTLLRIEHAVTDAGGAPATVRALLAYWFVSDSGIEPTHAGMQWADITQRLRRLRAGRWAYIVVQSIVDGGDETAALARMEQVVAGVWPAIRATPQAGETAKLTGPEKKD